MTRPSPFAWAMLFNLFLWLLIIGAGHALAKPLPPFAYIQFCVKNPWDCAEHKGTVPVGRAGRVVLTATLRKQLADVNRQVNAAIKPRPDAGPDTWSADVRFGDCEDYALTKRRRLLRMGWPSSALSIVVKMEGTQKHAVLRVRTTAGEIVLDNI